MYIWAGCTDLEYYCYTSTFPRIFIVSYKSTFIIMCAECVYEWHIFNTIPGESYTFVRFPYGLKCLLYRPWIASVSGSCTGRRFSVFYDVILKVGVAGMCCSRRYCVSLLDMIYHRRQQQNLLEMNDIKKGRTIENETRIFLWI